MPSSPKSAGSFRDSVGVVTHVVYYDTAYGDWPRVVAKLDELGVRHLRDGCYGNPAPAVARLERALLPGGRPGRRPRHALRLHRRQARRPEAARSTQLLAVARGRLRHAAEALEEPNEYDHFNGGRGWAARLTALQPRALPQGQAQPARCAGCRCVGPSLRRPRAAPAASATSAPTSTSATSTPTRAACRPTRSTCAPSSPRQRGLRPQAGVGDRGRLPQRDAQPRRGQPGVSERAAAVYLTRTFLEHFQSGIRRTYAYELLDETARARAGATRSSTSACCAATSRPSPPSPRSRTCWARSERGRHGPAAASAADVRGQATCAAWCCRRPTAPTSSRCGGWRASGTPSAAGRYAWARTR